MLTGERMIVREAARYWWVFLVSGILWLLIAWLVLRLNATSIATVGILLGVVLGLSGINEVGQATLSYGGWKVWHYILAAIFFLGALYGFIRPVNTFFALASVLGLILVFYGAFEIVQAVASRAVNPYWWLHLIMGILLVLLAFWVSGSDRVYALAQRTYLILFWVGFLALFRGFSQIFLAFTVRHAGHEAAAALGDTSPGSPPAHRAPHRPRNPNPPRPRRRRHNRGKSITWTRPRLDMAGGARRGPLLVDGETRIKGRRSDSLLAAFGGLTTTLRKPTVR